MKRRTLLASTLLSGTALGLGKTAAAAGGTKREEQKKAASGTGAGRDADVIVLGAGFSGLSAAVTAARAGARVLVLEKRAYAGGDGILSAGIIATAGTPLHKEQGIAGDLSVDAYWARIASGIEDEPLSKVRDNQELSPIYSGIFKHDPAVLRRSAENSPEVIAFLRSFGIEFLPINHGQPFLMPTKPGSMPKFAQALLEELKRLNVSLLTERRAQKILMDTSADSPRVCGVEVKTASGAVEEYRAPVVIVATGGFVNNKAMMRRYKRYWADVPVGFLAVGEGVPAGHDGDGIVMGKQIGASLEDMESMPKFYAAPQKGMRSPTWILFDTDTAYLVDAKGRRFCDEHASRYSGCAVKAYGKGIKEAFVVFDEATFTGPNKARWGYEALMKAGALYKADTIEEAAKKAGVDPAGLKATLETIARDARTGVDSEFGRRDKLFRALKAPFYVSTPSTPVCFKTEGGLEVNNRFEVLRASDDKPFGGLYAVGATCGSISSRLCDVIASGILAGPAAAEAAKKLA